jgi:hypothetical protein
VSGHAEPKKVKQLAAQIRKVRYDVDNKRPGHSLGPLGPHLNVAQPGKLADRVHYPLPGLAQMAWSVTEVLDVLLFRPARRRSARPPRLGRTADASDLDAWCRTRSLSPSAAQLHAHLENPDNLNEIVSRID